MSGDFGANSLLLNSAKVTSTFNINTINNGNGYIYRIFVDNSSPLGAQPTGIIGGNGYLLMGFSSILNNKPVYGIQIAFGFGAHKMAIRNATYNASGGAWTAWESLTALTGYTITSLNSCNVTYLYVRKEPNGLVHINGYFTCGAAVAAGANLDVGAMPGAANPYAPQETFSKGYCYDQYMTCLVWITGGKIQLYKASKAIPAGSVVVVNMCYMASS